MRSPQHRPAQEKFDRETMARTLIPLTHEDKDQSANLPLIQTLRLKQIKTSEANAGSAPPSFYEEDLKKWNDKYAKSINDRNEFKRKFLTGRKPTCLNSNDNVKD